MGKEKKNFKFVIVSPTKQISGGGIVLHAMCKYLEDLGYEARIFYIRYHSNPGSAFFWYKWFMYLIKDSWKIVSAPFLGRFFSQDYYGYIDVPIDNLKRKIFPWVDDNTIVVYPEVIKGKIFKTDKNVRWLLYYNSYEDGDIDIRKDMVVAFREEFNDLCLNPERRIVYCPYFNLNLYRQTNFGKRSGKCYIIHKGKKRADLPNTFDGIVVDSLSEKEKVKVFNECEYCISYDTQTGYSRIAALCGCISVIVPEEGKSVSDYRNDEDKRLGVAIGFSNKEIEFAKKTLKDLRQEMIDMDNASRKSVERFARYSEEYFRRGTI